MSDVSIISGHLLAFCPGRSILGISVPNITASRGSCGAVAACYVRPGGLEPPRPKTLDPKSNAATNYATGANVPQRYDFFLNCRPLCDTVHKLCHTTAPLQLHMNDNLSVCVSMKNGNMFYRIYRAAKYLFGYCSCYGDFDSFEFMQTDAFRLHRMASVLKS